MQRLLSRDRDRDRDRDHRLHNGSRSAQIAQVSQKRSERSSSSSSTGGGGGGASAAAGAGGDQHTALMDEFKRAHQRMFRNGFHESEHKVSSCSRQAVYTLLSPLAVAVCVLQQQSAHSGAECRETAAN